MRKLFFAIIVITIFVVSCSIYVKRSEKIETTKKVESIIITPINYGNGVYYFPCINKTFAKSLSFFLSDGTKKIKAMTGNETGVYGDNEGFFVVVEVEK